MLRRISFLAVLGLLTLTGCGGGKSAIIGDGTSAAQNASDVKFEKVGDGASGIQGIALAGPISPVVRPGEPNERPLPDAVIKVKRSKGKRVVARTKTDAEGRFHIPLPPGKYLLVPLPPQPNSPFPHPPAPMVVRVREGQFKDVELHYDTGIR